MTGSIWQATIVNETGDIQAGASVEVRDQATNALVTLWTTRATTATKTNPFTADGDGFAFFFRTPGYYKITVTKGAYTDTWNNVVIGDAGERAVGSASSTDIPDLAAADARYYQIGNDLSEVTGPSTAATNLGLGAGDAVTFASVDTGQGANELYAMNQDVETTDAVTFASVDTGQGANELYAMNQDVETSDNVEFLGAKFNGGTDYLSDYEKGTWTPTIADASFSAGEGQTMSTQVGQYIRIGDVVTCRFRLTITSLGTLTAGDQAVIIGLPFTATGDANVYGGCSINYAGSLAITANANVSGVVPPSVTLVNLYAWDSTVGATPLLISEVTAAGDMFGTIVYEV